MSNILRVTSFVDAANPSYRGSIPKGIVVEVGKQRIEQQVGQSAVAVVIGESHPVKSVVDLASEGIDLCQLGLSGVRVKSGLSACLPIRNCKKGDRRVRGR